VTRWDNLFADLEARFSQGEALECDAEVADRTRRERALISLQARLLANAGAGLVSVGVAGGDVTGRIADVGPDWFLLEETSHRAALVALAGVRHLTGLAAGAQEPTLVSKRFTLGAALRAVSRDRAVVEVVDVDGGSATGTIDAVGADHLEVAEHAPDEPRRSRNVIRTRVVPFGALACVRRL
jgi:hypothetical protein